MAFAGFKRIPAPRPGGRREPVHAPFMSPTGGWVTGANLASGPKGTALVLENFLPTATGLKMRKGSSTHGRASATEPLESAMTYIGGATRKLFAASNGGIFDLTTPVDPNTPPVASVSAQTSDYYSYVNVATPGGHYLMCANGTNNIQTFDGAAWAALVSGVGAGELNGVASDKISHLNTYRNRVWMVETGSMNAWYLPTDSIAGTVGQVSLSGVFQKGGSLLFTATWSLDTGAGLDDKIVFVSSEGEVAVYQGDPSDTAFGLVGLYEASPPLGKNAWLKVGGDLLILTQIGIIPLSAIISKDPGALALAAVSRNIQPDWVKEAQLRSGLPWEIMKWSAENVAIVSCPVTSSVSATPPICFAVNLETGAWSKITGWNARCLVLHDDRAYFGTNDGRLVRMETGGSDDGNLIYYTYVGQFEHLAGVGRHTTVMQARAIFRAQNSFTPKIDVTTDYKIELPSYPDAADVPGGSQWDAGLWDTALWDAGGTVTGTIQTRWTSVGRSGFSHAPVLQIVSGSAGAPVAELVMFEVTHQPGGLVV